MKSLPLLFLMFPGIAWSQISYNFESGSLSSWMQSRDSAWCITDTDALSGSKSLWHRLDDSLSGEDRISFAYDSLVITGSQTIWQFSLRHSYLPSSSNNWAVFLLSDRNQEEMRPDANLNAIILGVNFKGSDDVLKLWRMKNGKIEILAETSLNWQEEIGTDMGRLGVERSPSGEWKVFIASETVVQEVKNPLGTGSDGWELIGSGRDSFYISPGYFGICYRFSSRQDRKLWVDDISVQGTFIRDTIPPSITGLRVSDEKTMILEFSELLDMTTALNKDRYSISDGEAKPDSVFFQSGTALVLVFEYPFESEKTETLRIIGMSDRKGNVADILEEDFTWFRARSGDILINEIMYDPEPEVLLPGYEYIELYNRSGFTVGMEGWMIRSGAMAVILPEIEFPSATYLLICYKESAEHYREASLVSDALGSRTTFSNEGSIICLFDRDSALIDWMEYSPEMHSDEFYASGGWSLELIDADRDCYASDNWTSSRDKKGGTPGKENSVKRKNPDKDSPLICSVYLPDSVGLVLKFNETMDMQTLLSASEWRVEMGPASGSGSVSGNVGLAWYPDTIEVNYPFNRELRLVYPGGFKPGKDYCLKPGPGIKDCSGNPISTGSGYRFAMPVQPGRAEILITEVLFNPMPFCPDFIEVYNPGPAVFDLADIGLANRDPETAGIISATRIMSGHRLFFPGEYLVFTSDPETLTGCYTVYDQNALIKVRDMPVMGDDKGSVLIIDKFLEVIDEFSYDKGMHHPGLDSKEGVSLERISYSFPAGNRSNWHSASSNDGFASPGRMNSQYTETLPISEGFELEPEIFSPDMDGREDLLFIKYHFRSPGQSARILIFDPRGRLIKIIAGKELLGTEGFFTWDGTDRNGQMARTGIYLVSAEVSGKEGFRKFRMPCVLSRNR